MLDVLASPLGPARQITETLTKLIASKPNYNGIDVYISITLKL